MYLKKGKIFIFLIALAIIFSLTGCGFKEEMGVISNDTQQAEKNTKDTGEAAKLIEATNKYLSSGRAPTISAEDVYKNAIVGGDAKYFLVEIRKPEDYAKGHPKGAINIPYAQFYMKDNLAKLPKDKKIVVICYTGHTASQITIFLNQMGYEAYAMKYGMSGWTTDPYILAINPFTKAMDYPNDKSTVEAKSTNSLPIINTGFKNADDIIMAQTEKYLISGRAPTVSAGDINKAINEGDSKYFLLSVRKAEDDAKGHVKGALTIPYAQMAKEDSLKKLPKDKKIVVICYTGHTASQITMFLNQLGYDAYAMKYGMMGWTTDKDVLGIPVIFNPPNYPVVTGANPG